ncbi:MAG: hypothetical protein ABI910_07205 [Gemmatimonadota bacterium]
MGRDIQWRDAVVRLLVAARPMTMAARLASGGAAARALAGWSGDTWGESEQSVARADAIQAVTCDAMRPNALERVIPISLVDCRPMGVRPLAGTTPVRRPRETATWRERWPDVAAVPRARPSATR